MLDLIFKNLLILYVGVGLRYLYYKLFKKNNYIKYSQLLYGIKNPKTKDEEIQNKKNEFINRLYSIFTLSLIVLVIAIIQKYS